MPTDLKALTRRFYDEVINQRNVDLFDQYIHDDFVEHEEIPGMPSDKEGPRRFMEMIVSAFPDFSMSLEDLITEGDKAVVRARMSGTHRGEFMGAAPTGSKFDIQLIDILRFQDDKVIEHWGVTDMAAMIEQLGIAPPG